MSRFKKIFLILIAAAAMLGTALFLCYDRIAAAALSGKYGLDISYKGCSKDLSGAAYLNNLSVSSRKTGLGIVCEKAKIRPRLIDKKIVIDFDLTDVNFMRRGPAGPVSYDTLTALVSDPFSSSWKYARMAGSIALTGSGVKIREFETASDRIKLSLKGEYKNSGTIDFDIVIYFATELVDKIAPELAATLLAEDEGGWKRLSVHISGDMSKPAIQVSSKRFRLSIRSVSGN